MLGWLKWGTSGVRPHRLDTIEDAVRTVRELARFSQAVAETLGTLSKLEILQGKLITGCRMDGTTSANFFPHGLNRPFRGCILVGQSWTSTQPLIVYSPEQVSLANRDPSTVFGLISLSAITSTIVNAWVF